MEFENLPEGWQKIIFTDAIDINPRLSIKKGTPSTFIEMKAVPEHQRKIAFTEIRDFSSGSKFRNGDTLFSRITPCVENGKTAYCDVLPENEIGFGSTEFLVFAKKDGITNSKFIYYLSRYEPLRKYAIANMNGTSGRQRVEKEAFGKLNIALPPLPQQQKIASILGALDDKIELNNQMNQTLETMAKALFKSWFVDFDPFQDGEFDESELGMIPKGWKVGTYNSEVSIYGGSTPSTTNPEFWDNGSHYWATPKDLSGNTSPVILETNRKITDKGLKKISSKQLPIGTVLLSSRAPVGYLAIAQVPISINQGFIAMVCDKTISNIYTLLWTQHKMEEIKNRAGGSTFAEISKTNFRTISVMVPNNDTMAAFNQKVEPLYAQIAMNCRQILSLTSIRNSLLPKLMSGEIEV